MNTRYFNYSEDIIRWAILLYVRYPLSLRQVEELLSERGMDVSYETVRLWWNRFGPEIAKSIRNRRKAGSLWSWYLDEAFVRINGKPRYLWRAVDHEGEVLDCVVTKKRDKAAALQLLRRLLKRNGVPATIVTDKLRSYPAALRELGFSGEHYTEKWANNRAENSHQPIRRRERAMQRFRSMATLQKFVAIHAQIHNHFNHERHRICRQDYKVARSRSLQIWQKSCA